MAKKVGVSVYSYKDAMRVLEHDDFEIVQIPFNVFDQSYYSKGIFREAEKRNKTVFIRSIFLQGLLLIEQEELGKDKKNFMSYLQARDSLCVRFGLTKKELAIGYVKKRAGGAYIVFGAEEPSQVEETVLIFEKADINDEITEEIEQQLPVTNEDIVNPSNWSKRY
jgi:aryl-alcohol dehydrogenase-like predicted oxidoreductase